jgi:hypothetical protein
MVLPASKQAKEDSKYLCDLLFQLYGIEATLHSTGKSHRIYVSARSAEEPVYID